MVKNGQLYTPFADACLHGVTRGLVIQLAEENNIPIQEKNISLTELYNADELFATGTMGELTPIVLVDGRKIENRSGMGLYAKMNELFKACRKDYCVKI